MTADFVYSQMRAGLLAIIAYCAGAGVFTPAESTLFVALISSFGPLIVPIAFSVYSNWNARRVPTNSAAGAVAIAERQGAGPAELGAVAKTAALSSCLVLAIFCFAGPAMAQQKNKTPLAILANSALVQFFADWTADDISGAEKLSIAIPDLQDTVGQACWQTFATMGAVIKEHPLPATFKLASDIEAARLFAKAVKLVCVKPECSQVWNDLQNQVAAFTPIPAAVSLASICAKIP